MGWGFYYIRIDSSQLVGSAWSHLGLGLRAKNLLNLNF